MEFDWYQATVPEKPDFIADAVVMAYDDHFIETGCGRLNYESSTTVRRANGDTVLTVLHGGQNGNPNVQATSHYAGPVAAILREHWPVHEVTRCDVASDMMAPGVFDALHPLCQTVARKHRMKGRIQLPDDLDDGRTYYLGSTASQAFARLYEKGKEQFKKTGDPAFRDMFDWVRLEMQVRPQRDNRQVVAGLAPEQVWGLTRWSRELASEALSIDAAKVGVSAYRRSKDEVTRRHMMAQFGNVFTRWADEVGSWAELGIALKEGVAQIKRERMRS